MKKIIIYLFIACTFASSCKLSVDKKIGKVERKIERTKAQIEKKKNKITGFEQQLVILREEQEAILAQGGNEADKKKVAEIQKKKEELEKLQKDLAALEESVTSNLTTKKSKSVTLLTAEKSRFAKYVDIQGEVTSKENILVSAETGGTIKSISVSEGQRVSRGQTLASIDADIIYSNIAEAENALSLATTVYEKQKRLWDQNIGSEIQFLEAKNNKENLEKKIATLNTQLSKTRVKAPFSGTVDQVVAHAGETVGAGTPIARVVNLSNVQVEAEVSESYIGKFKKGDEVLIEFPAIDRRDTGKIKAVGQFINPGNRTFVIEIDMKNKSGLLKPNLLANLKLLEYQSDDKVVIPSRLVQQSLDGDFTYTMTKDSIVQKNILETGNSYDGKIEILSGLEAGYLVIDRGSRDVIIGDKIKPTAQQ